MEDFVFYTAVQKSWINSEHLSFVIGVPPWAPLEEFEETEGE